MNWKWLTNYMMTHMCYCTYFILSWLWWFSSGYVSLSYILHISYKYLWWWCLYNCIHPHILGSFPWYWPTSSDVGCIFSECRFRCSVPGSIVILRAHCSTSSVVVSPHVLRTWCLMLVSQNYLHLITEYESVGACLNGSLVLLIFLEACQTSIDVGSWLISRILLSFWNSFILGWWLLCWYLRVIYGNPIDLCWTEWKWLKGLAWGYS